MKFYNSFPQTPVYGRARIALLLPCLLLISGLVANAQTNGSRPVARLIASSGHSIQTPAARPRAVYVARASASENAHENAHASLSINATTDERRVFDLINQARRAQGYAPLVWDAELTRMAREHSAEMAGQNFLSHEGPDGGMVERAHERGIRGWQALAENIAYNQGFDDPAGFAVERWLKSAKHRDNIMRASFTHTGLGVARTPDGRIYFTQVFVAR
jgi:uncharacterized protein YkwD